MKTQLEDKQQKSERLMFEMKEMEKELEKQENEVKKAYQEYNNAMRINEYNEQKIVNHGKQKDKLNKTITTYQKKVKNLEADRAKVNRELKDYQKIIDNFISVQEKIEKINTDLGDAPKVKLSREVLRNMVDEMLKDKDPKKATPDITTKQRTQVFEQTLENMRLVVNYDYNLNRHHAKIYYHDKVNNVARLMVDQIALLCLKGSNDLVQEEVIEVEKKIMDPEFTMFEFQNQVGMSFMFNGMAHNQEHAGGSDYKQSMDMESQEIHIGRMEHEMARGEPQVIIEDEDELPNKSIDFARSGSLANGEFLEYFEHPA